MPPAIPLTLAHSPDPDDAFMWWPLTGKINPDGSRQPGDAGKPCIDTGRFHFNALPADIHVLNQRAAREGDLEITALSARAYADVKDRYIITACGGSFGDGYGPKVVVRDNQSADAIQLKCDGCLATRGVRIAVPGRQTTAFLLLGLALGPEVAKQRARFIEMPFEKIIGAVARREVDAGLVIHEGQLTFADAGLRMMLDVGAWWKGKTGLLTPLGVNAIRRDLDNAHGSGTVNEIASLLNQSVAYSMEHRDESTRYTLPFALANVVRGGETGEAPTLERVERYCRMYVTPETLDMGERGRAAIARLLKDGAAAGLCPDPGPIDLA
ncbi:MAG: ABC transporter substrate-binding protein [Phycisphaeraceae bacterium]|nr:ABC transporter substrate-binding protein [Phycisphaeraceae bacterium]